MTGTAGDVIRVAKSQVGYHEGYSGGHWNNNQKYSAAVPGLEWSNYQAWCATFCAWVFQEAGMPKGSYPVTASCALGVSWWKKENRFSEYPAIGAQVFFGPGGGSHTGLVYAYDATYIYTVEGNTNSSGSAEGDGVYLKKRSRRDSYVYGYGYPAYPSGIVTADPTWKNSIPAPQEADVALTTDDINKVASAVFAKLLKTDDVLAAPSDAADYATNKFWTWQTHIQDVTNRVRGLDKKVDALPAVDLSDTQIATLASAVAANPALAEQIAEKVAVKLAERLAE